MEAGKTKDKLAYLKEELGYEIDVFVTSEGSTSERAASSHLTPGHDEPEGFYELTAEDYYRLCRSKKEENFLKTREMREAEETERRSKMNKAIIRVRFPDNYTLVVKFHPSDTSQSLMHLLMKVIARPDLPFYIYTANPKKQVVDLSKDFYSLGFVPGAIVYFSYDLSKVGGNEVGATLPFLRSDVLAFFSGLEVIHEQRAELEPPSAELEMLNIGTAGSIPVAR